VDEFMGGREKGGYLIRQYPGKAVFLSGDAVSKECDFARSGLQITCHGRKAVFGIEAIIHPARGIA
jgi:hypothetical protein